MSRVAHAAFKSSMLFHTSVRVSFGGSSLNKRHFIKRIFDLFFFFFAACHILVLLFIVSVSNVGIVTFCRHIERQPLCAAASKPLYFSRLRESVTPHNQSAHKELELSCRLVTSDGSVEGVRFRLVMPYLKKKKKSAGGSMSGGDRGASGVCLRLKQTATVWKRLLLNRVKCC